MNVRWRLLLLSLSLLVLFSFGVTFFFHSPSISTKADSSVEQSVSLFPLPPQTPEGEVDYEVLSQDPVLAIPSIGIVSVVSDYHLEFPINQTIDDGGSFILAFFGGFSFTEDCETVDSALENLDINGSYPGVVTISSLDCDSIPRQIRVYIEGASLLVNQNVHFTIQGVTNPSQVRSPLTSDGYYVGIKTYRSIGTHLDTLASEPFYLEALGDQSISGTVFLDDGAGGGTENDGLLNGTELGVEATQVCLSGDIGQMCEISDSEGAYQFDFLEDGTYQIEIVPPEDDAYFVAQTLETIQLSDNESLASVDLALRSSNRQINVTVYAIPENRNVYVYAFDASTTSLSPWNRRTIVWNGETTRSVLLPVSNGVWEVGVDSVSTRKIGSEFVSPEFQEVKISNNASQHLYFTIPTLNERIKGIVVDQDGEPLSHAIVYAQPMIVQADRFKESYTESLVDGSFELSVSEGVYTVFAKKNGMVSSEMVGVTVFENELNSDDNTSADVYRAGTLLVNDGGELDDDLSLTILNNAYAVTGRLLNANASMIPRAFVEAYQVNGDGDYLGQMITTPTDANGIFVLFLESGRWRIRALVNGFGEMDSQFVTVTDSDVTGIDLQADLDELGTVSGSVTINGTGIKGVSVTLSNDAGVSGAVTDTNGNYSLTAQPAAGYTLRGYSPGIGSTSTLTGLTVQAGLSLEDQDLSLNEAGILRVSLDGVTDAIVDARTADGTGNGTGANPNPGVYDIYLSEGTYTLRAQSPTHGVIGSTDDVSVSSGEITSVSYSAPQSSTVSGSVTSRSSYCKNEATVVISDTESHHVIFSKTDQSGTYSAEVPDGVYVVSATKPGCEHLAIGPTIRVAGQSVDLAVEIVLNPANITLSGQVLLSGVPVGVPARVVATSSSGDVNVTSVEKWQEDSDNYTLNLQEGEWTVTAVADGYASASSVVNVVPDGIYTLDLALLATEGFSLRESISMPFIPALGTYVNNPLIDDLFELAIPANVLGSDRQPGSLTLSQTTSVVTETAFTKVVGSVATEILPVNEFGESIKSLSGYGVLARFPYSEEAVLALGYEENDVVLATWSEESGEWIALPTTVDEERNMLTAWISHFSLFAPVVKKQQVAGEISNPAPVNNPTPSGHPRPEIEFFPPVEVPTLPVPEVFDPLKFLFGETEVVPVQESVKQVQEITEEEKIRSEPVVILSPPTKKVIEQVLKEEGSVQKDRIGFWFHILDSSEIIRSGDKLSTEGIIRYQGSASEFTLRYQVVNADHRVILEETEVIPAGSSVHFKKVFPLGSKVAPGSYLLYVKFSDGKIAVRVVDGFEIVGSAFSEYTKESAHIVIQSVRSILLTRNQLYVFLLLLTILSSLFAFLRKLEQFRKDENETKQIKA